jgi:thiamine kinase-like enzyme
MRWQQLVEQVKALQPDWDVAEFGAFRFLEGGYSNANYRFRYHGGEFVLRLPGKPSAYTDREREERFYRSVRSLPAPEVVAFDARTGAMISRWISGRLLADHEPDLERAAGYLRDLHARLRAAEADAAGALDRTYDPLVHARTSLAAASAPGWIRRIADARAWEPPSVTVCHNDLNPWNLIETEDGTWITLDWEWVGRNDPLFDVVGLHQGCGYREAVLPRLAEAILGEPPEPGRLEACLTAFWLREYGWAEAEVAAGNRRAEIVAQRDLGMRKLRALHPPSPR